MDSRELLIDQFERIHELYAGIAGDLDTSTAHERPGGTGNSIAWLLWHTARVQDDHVAGLTGGTQAWSGWESRFDLPFEAADIGYGHTSEEVDHVRIASFEDLLGYHEAVHRLSLDYLAGAGADELDRVVDERWDPPVTACVRLVSVLADCLQHLGQAAYAQGLVTAGSAARGAP